jgi:hypothetical protein
LSAAADDCRSLARTPCQKSGVTASDGPLSRPFCISWANHCNVAALRYSSTDVITGRSRPLLVIGTGSTKARSWQWPMLR